jgi:hypothetical protein
MEIVIQDAKESAITFGEVLFQSHQELTVSAPNDYAVAGCCGGCGGSGSGAGGCGGSGSGGSGAGAA